MNITWRGVENFEDYENGRELMKEIGRLLKKEDPYQHLALHRHAGHVSAAA